MTNSKLIKNEKISKLDVARYVLLGICLIPEGTLLVAYLCYCIFYLIPEKGISRVLHEQDADVWCLLAVVLFLAITIAGLIRTRRKMKTVLLTGFLMKVEVFCAMMGMLFREEDVSRSVPNTFFGIAICIVVLLFYIFIPVKETKPKKNNSPKFEATPRRIEFNGFDVEGARARAREEYLYLHNKNPEQLTSDDNNLIDRYAVGEVAYLATWLVRKGFVSESFKKKCKNSSEINKYFFDNAVVSHSDPAVFVLQYLKGNLRRSDVKKEIHFFLDYYVLDPDEKYLRFTHPAPDTLMRINADVTRDRYLFDYYRYVVSDPEEDVRVMYCRPFSWERYRIFEKILDDRYKDVVLFISEGRSSRSIDKGVLHSNVYNADLKIIIKDGVSDTYLKSICDSFDPDAERITTELCERISSEILPGQDVSAEDIMGGLSPFELEIFKPISEEEKGYLVTAKIDGLENKYPDHYTKETSGVIVCWIVRDGVLVSVHPLFGSYSPWDFEETFLYKRRLGRTRDRSELIKIRTVPERFINQPTDYIYMSPEMSEIKNYYDSMIEALMMKGLVDYYDIQAINDEKYDIPRELVIQGQSITNSGKIAISVNILL